MDQERPKELKGTGYELFILLLSILSVVNAALVALPLGQSFDVAISIDTITIPIFLSDFGYRFLTAESRRHYFLRGWGWADLLASLPLLRVFRVFRIVRVVRLIRAYGAARIVRDLELARASATFYLTIFLVILVVEVAGIAIYYTEDGAPDANIHNAGDAIWWGLVTITTVGYGDRYPVTEAGRVVGVFLLFAGIALFSVLTGFIANAFLAPQIRKESTPAPGTPQAVLTEFRRLLDQQEASTAALRETLEHLEQQLARPTSSGESASPGGPSPVPSPDTA